MDLFCREVGRGFPVVVLHGLYGSSDNWLSIAKQFGEHYRVILVDQRNHGNSPHTQTHTYNDLANDLFGLVRKLGLTQFHLIGHSMGGRAAMLFQTLYPNFLKSLIVVDVAPWGYSGTDKWFVDSYNEHKAIIKGMKSLTVGSIESRIEADKLLSVSIPSDRLRQFLFKNLRRDSQGKFYWSINLDVLDKSLEEMILGVDVDRRLVQELDVLFIKGENSNYIHSSREGEISEIYPKAKLVNVKNAGHWVHAELPQVFVDEVLSFISSI